MNEFMSINDAEDIRDEIKDFFRVLETAEMTDRVEYHASNGTTVMVDGWRSGYYTLDIVDKTRTSTIKMVFDTLIDVRISEEFVGGKYVWMLNFDGFCNREEVYIRLPLVDEPRRGEVGE
jgi:hypothetical protein